MSSNEFDGRRPLAYACHAHLKKGEEVMSGPLGADALDEPGGLVTQWVAIGRANPWISQAWDPPFDHNSFQECHSIQHLRDRISHCNWSVGTAFHITKDGHTLCLINQVDGGDEWLAIRHGIPFESITFGPMIDRGEFEDFVERLLRATKEQCESLTY